MTKNTVSGCFVVRPTSTCPLKWIFFTNLYTLGNLLFLGIYGIDQEARIYKRVKTWVWHMNCDFNRKTHISQNRHRKQQVFFYFLACVNTTLWPLKVSITNGNRATNFCCT